MEKINQSQIAKVASISRSYLCGILRGKLPMSRTMAQSLGQAFGLDPGRLIFAAPGDLKKLLAEAQARCDAAEKSTPQISEE